MKIMGIPDEEQIGMNPLKGLKMQGNERENRSYLYGFFLLLFSGSLVGLVFLLVLFCLVCTPTHPLIPPQQRASKKL